MVQAVVVRGAEEVAVETVEVPASSPRPMSLCDARELQCDPGPELTCFPTAIRASRDPLATKGRPGSARHA
jgi:hypothetical protein